MGTASGQRKKGASVKESVNVVLPHRGEEATRTVTRKMLVSYDDERDVSYPVKICLTARLNVVAITVELRWPSGERIGEFVNPKFARWETYDWGMCKESCVDRNECTLSALPGAVEARIFSMWRELRETMDDAVTAQAENNARYAADCELLEKVSSFG